MASRRESLCILLSVRIPRSADGSIEIGPSRGFEGPRPPLSLSYRHSDADTIQVRIGAMVYSVKMDANNATCQRIYEICTQDS